MSEEDLLYALALQRSRGIGDINAKKLIAYYGSPKNVLQEKRSALERINGIGRQISRQLLDPQNLRAAEKELNYIANNDISTYYYESPDYPTRLKHCIDAPIVLFKKGNSHLQQNHVISIVGTRNMTAYGRDFCRQFVKELAPFNPIIVSGFAYGIDICAHKEALKNNLETIAVLAHGFEEIYPVIHNKYVDEILLNGGFLTDFWHDEPIIRENFIKRNRIVAGISEATIVVESAKKGGALITADIANSYNRDVFAIPGRTTDSLSIGCNNLIAHNKAALINSAEELAIALNWTKENESKSFQKKMFVELEAQEQKIYDYLLDKGPEILDLIALECQKTIQETAALLFAMEMKSVVKPLPGKRFEAI